MIKTANKNKLTSQLPLLTIGAILIGAIIGSVATWLGHQQYVALPQSQLLTQLARQQAQLHAKTVAQFIADYQEQLDRFANRKSSQMFVKKASEDLGRGIKSSLSKHYPDAVAVRIYNRARVELMHASDEQPLSFVERDMMNRLELSESITPEVTRLKGKLHFKFIAAIREDIPDKDTQRFLGSLIITLPAKPLIDELAQGKALGHIHLQQWMPQGAPRTILTSGSKSNYPSFKADIANSDWLIKFTPSEKMAEQASQSSILVFSIGGAITLLLAGISGWLAMRFDPIIRQRQLQQATSHSASSTSNSAAIMDINVAAEDQELLGIAEAPVNVVATATTSDTEETLTSVNEVEVPSTPFRAYDIRGIVDQDIDSCLAKAIGQAIGSETLAQGESHIFVARDGRNHSQELSQSLSEGILSTGCNVIDLGSTPTPLLYFATNESELTRSGVMVTASHNPAEYNGFKIVINGRTLAGEDIQALRSRIVSNDFEIGSGEIQQQNIVTDYIDRIFSDVALAGDAKVVIDAGNGITGNIAPQLFQELGCDVIPLYCDVDGNFPNHTPDPSIASNFDALIAKVKETGADLGIAFDGDGDRLGVVSSSGEIIWPDRLLMLFAKDIVSGHPGCDVLYDVKCTREINTLVSSYGGRPIMWQTGHANMKAKMQETGALIGGELSGHFYIKDRWYGFDDGLYAAARLLEIMTLRDQSLDEIFISFPVLPCTPEIKIAVDEGKKFALIDTLIKQGQFESGERTTLDGLRVDFSKGWGLVRASNTSPALTLRFEGETEAVIDQPKKLFKRELLKIEPSLDITF